MKLINLIKEQFGDSIISSLASKTGESESGITKAVAGLLPTIIGGLSNNAEKPEVLEAITKTDSNSILGNLLEKIADDNSNKGLLTSIFGDKIGDILSSIASFSGISNSSASSLLNVVTGATLGSVGKYATDNNLDKTGISKLLGDQKGFLASLLPDGFNLDTFGLDGISDKLTGAIGSVTGGVKKVTEELGGISDKITTGVMDSVGVGAKKVTDSISGIENSIPSISKDNSNIKWLLSLLLIGLLAFLGIKQCCAYTKSCEKPTSEVNAASVTPLVADSMNTNADKTTLEKVATQLTLPSGSKINAFVGGIEDQAITFLGSEEYKNATAEELKNKWFSFDNVNFEFGTTKLTAESLVQIENLKAILNDFKDSKIKIGAYSDKKGDDATNLKISQNRAEVVKQAINSTQVVGAEGYGEQFAKVDENATDKERESDRKISIRFEK